MTFNTTSKILKVILGATATVTLSGCPAFADSITTSTSEVHKDYDTYICEGILEDTRNKVNSIMTSPSSASKEYLLILYRDYENSLVSIQQECPEDNQDSWEVLEAESLVKSLMESKLKYIK